MNRARAAAGSAVFFVLAPGAVVGLVPWWLTGWIVEEPTTWWAPLRIVGAILLAAGSAVLVHAFVRFASEGIGTPAPVAPPTRLVVGGLYRYVRNPMYLGGIAAIAGQSLVLGQPSLLVYAAAVLAASYAFVRAYEEPALLARFGDQYDAYRRAVPGWWPRRRPWAGHGGGNAHTNL
ncbi:MAG: isoprenylcysteine carboxylmethyltransferase family protein [Candidatus Dormibacteraeota bacterium]|nr:isoprenylcysteine carboxylmethyltransferase family protein [Candidatus Dormibacteraeota bacterium]MBO0705225.1 isoprenylcysteine carboxylmethyltransferase family protein [Candidatus Dormibacteraeota bacterium]MBO0761616.1 isoprenylcysteine carboxylmethyltransferase family protein [Candidatus Dormibacteraeota bacterium]